MAVLSHRAVRQLRERLPDKPLAKPVYGGRYAEPFVNGASSVKRGSPQQPHAGDGVETQTYDLDDGSILKGVLNKTGVAALTTANYWIFFYNGEWSSFPAELDLCNPTNPIQ